jgi:hypothetical protein
MDMPFGFHRFKLIFNGLVQYMTVQKDDGIQGLLLSRCRYLTPDGRMGLKMIRCGFYPSVPHGSDPHEIGFIGRFSHNRFVPFDRHNDDNAVPVVSDPSTSVRDLA